MLYVDDMLIAFKSKSTIDKLKKDLSSELEMNDLGEAKKVLGMEIEREQKATMSLTTIEEREYISHVPYTSAVGSLMYAMVCTRPDLSQTVLMVSKYMHELGRDH